MNWRAIGCLGLGALVFVGIGLLGMSMAFSGQEGCPASLAWQDRTYLAYGSPAASPALPDESGDPASIGATFFGLATRTVYGPPGSSPSTRAEDRPDRIVMDCADGSFQAYRWDAASPLPAHSP